MGWMTWTGTSSVLGYLATLATICLTTGSSESNCGRAGCHWFSTLL
jgi:hypothetical protein